MPLDPAQCVFPWYDDQNHKAAIAQELAVRESVARQLPLVELLIEQSEHRILEEVLQDTSVLHERLSAVEDKLDMVIHAIRSEEDPSEALSNIEIRPISPTELADVEQLHIAFLQKAFSELNQVRSYMYDTQDELQVLHHGLAHLNHLFHFHVQCHSEDENAADWWKQGDEPF